MRRVLIAALVLAFGLALPSGATPIGFECITGDNAESCAIGEAQFSVEVTWNNSLQQVLFQFSNTAAAYASITDVYFDDGALLAIASVEGSPGVAFTELATPGDLPGGNEVTPPFVTTAGFSADSDPPITANGVDTSAEWLNILFTLQPGMTFANVLADLDSGALRIGIHAQGFAGGFSESFINTIEVEPQPPVPEPGALLMAGIGLVLLGVRRFARLR